MRLQYRILFALAVFLAIMISSCTNEIQIVSTPTAVIATTGPTSVPQQVDTPVASADGTFVDRNNLLAFDLPVNWARENASKREYYTDTFLSPDGAAKIESFIYNDGEPFDPSKNKDFALYLLNTYYSNSGTAGEIKIVTDQMMDTGLERFEWTAEDGSYSGISFFELRGDNLTTFLMFTARWTSATDPATLDVINTAIASIRIP